MKHVVAVVLTVLLLALWGWAAPPTLINRNGKWPPQSGTAFGFGGPYEFASQAVPTSTTIVTSITAHVIGVWIHNVSGSPVTLTFKDRQGSPQPLPLDGNAITSPSDVSFNAPFGVLASGGMTIAASGSGLFYEIVFTN